jgi:hypothetical protein
MNEVRVRPGAPHSRVSFPGGWDARIANPRVFAGGPFPFSFSARGQRGDLRSVLRGNRGAWPAGKNRAPAARLLVRAPNNDEGRRMPFRPHGLLSAPQPASPLRLTGEARRPPQLSQVT